MAAKKSKKHRVSSSLEHFMERHSGVASVSELAGFLSKDEQIVRRWARDNGVRRLGPNFAFTLESATDCQDAMNGAQAENVDITSITGAERLVNAARKQGNSGGDEVGELRQIVYVCWQRMTPDACFDVFRTLSELLDDAECS